MTDETNLTEQIEIHQPVNPEESGEKKSGLKTKVGGAVGLLAVLFKFKAIIFLTLTKLKFILVVLKFTKIFTTFGSMFATIVIDAMFWGWSFAIGFVILLFIHEMGHALMLKSKGISAGAPVFIPFVGAIIAMKDMPHNAKDEAEVGIAGPILGTAGAVLCLQLGIVFGSQLLVRLAYVGFMLNLFNLLPILPLDGGRVMAAISPKVWLVGLILAAVMLIKTHNPLLLVLIIMSIGRTWQGIKSTQEDQEYYNVPRVVRVKMTAAYFGLAGFLAYMLMALHHPVY